MSHHINSQARTGRPEKELNSDDRKGGDAIGEVEGRVDGTEVESVSAASPEMKRNGELGVLEVTFSCGKSSP